MSIASSDIDSSLLPPDSSKPKHAKLKTCCVWTCGISSLLLLVLAIVLPIILPGLIKKLAADGIVMTPETEGLWGHIPGNTETITIRNYTFFNFTNSKGFLYRNETPVFKEVTGYTYIEYQDFENIQYENDSNIVNYDFWLHFGFHEKTRDTNEKVKVVNLGPLGFWYQLQSQDYSTFTIQALGQLYPSLKDTLKDTVLGQGVSQQFFPDNKTAAIALKSYGIDDATFQFLWNDKIYGLGSPDTFDIWVQASRDFDSGAYSVLMNYFALEAVQLNPMLLSIRENTKTIESIISNWYCGQDVECSNIYMALVQLGSAGITNNPPPGSDKIVSICSQNHTCAGYPEIANYLEYVFPKEFPNTNATYQGVTYTIQQLNSWFECDHEPYCLLNIGNLDFIWEQGRRFDSNPDDVSSLQLIKKRFNIDNNAGAVVLWYWIKYISKEFALKESIKGTKGVAGIGGVASQAISLSFVAAQDYIYDLLTSKKLAALLLQKYETCSKFINSTIFDIDPSTVDMICQGVHFQNSDSVIPWTSFCDIEYGAVWESFRTKYQLTNLQMAQFCDPSPDEDSLRTLMADIHADLDDYYDCDLTLAPKCSKFELALKQWNRSEITRRVIPEMTDRDPSDTINAWNSDIPSFEFEYFLKDSEQQQFIQRPEASHLAQLLSYDYLFSGPVIQEMILENDPTAFAERFPWKSQNIAILKSYIKYMMIEVGFGGFTQERSAQQLVFGYEDPFLKQLKEMDPKQGGDPSIGSTIALNEPNATRQQAKLNPQSVYSGKNDRTITRFYRTINGTDKIKMYKQSFDGNQVYGELVNPWAEDDHFIGTDAFQAAPGLSPDPAANNISIYITSLYRYGVAHYNQTIERFGMDIFLCRVDPELYANSYDLPKNSKYYQLYTGFVNESSINGVPLFVSKSHFLDSPSNWSQLVDIYDESGLHKQEANIWDDMYIHIEPNTGTSFCATIYLQGNYLFTSDELFERNSTAMLPVFSLFRSGNISENAVEKYFGPLKIAKKARIVIPILFGVLSGFFMIVAVGTQYIRRKDQKKARDQKDGRLEISLQEQKSAPAPVYQNTLQQSVAVEEYDQNIPRRDGLGVQHVESTV